MAKRLFVLFLLAFASFAYSSSVYKWVDEDGTVHYSDKKPVDKQSEKLRMKTGSTQSQPSENLQEQVDNLDRQQQIEQVRQKQERENVAADQAKQEFCDNLKTNLETLRNNARIRMKDEDGEYRFLTPEEIVDQTSNNQKRYDEQCN